MRDKLLKDFRATLNEGMSSADLADILHSRLTVRYPDVLEKYGFDAVEDAVQSVAEDHAGLEELGTSDVSIMVREIIKQLESSTMDEGIDQTPGVRAKYRATVEYGPTAADAKFVTVTAGSTEEAEQKVYAWCVKNNVRNPMITINGADLPMDEDITRRGLLKGLGAAEGLSPQPTLRQMIKVVEKEYTKWYADLVKKCASQECSNSEFKQAVASAYNQITDRWKQAGFNEFEEGVPESYTGHFNDDDWYEVDANNKVLRHAGGHSAYRPSMPGQPVKLPNGNTVVRGMKAKSLKAVPTDLTELEHSTLHSYVSKANKYRQDATDKMHQTGEMPDMDKIGRRAEFTMKAKHRTANQSDELNEDWQKVNKSDKTDGMSSKAVKAYRRENPGSKLKTAVTTKPSKLKPGSKAAKRRKSFCARMSGMKGPMKDEKGRPTAKAKALSRWNCHEDVAEDKDPCWDGYKQIGMKKKSGKSVPNCVPVKENEGLPYPGTYEQENNKFQSKGTKHTQAIAFESEKIAGRHDPKDFDDMVSRVGKLAKQGPLKTVWDPVKRVYKNVPVNKEPVKESSIMRGINSTQLDEGWKGALAGAALAGMAALGGGQAHAAPVDSMSTQYLQSVVNGAPRPLVSIDAARQELQARASGKQQAASPDAPADTTSTAPRGANLKPEVLQQLKAGTYKGFAPRLSPEEIDAAIAYQQGN